MSKSKDPVQAWGQQFKEELENYFNSLSAEQKAFCERYHQYKILKDIAEESALLHAREISRSTEAKKTIKNHTYRFAEYSSPGNNLPCKDADALEISTHLVLRQKSFFPSVIL